MNIRDRKEIENLASYAMELALKKGAAGADVLYAEGAGNALSLIDGEVEDCVCGENSGMGVRTILSDGRQGIAYGNRLDRHAIEQLAEWSFNNAKLSEPEEGIQLYKGEMVSDPSIALEDEAINRITPQDRKIGRAHV